MDRVNWRTHLPPDSRQKITNKIFETLNRHLPVSEPEGINELKKIATRFEDKVFRSAVNQTDYLRQISGKMLTLETKSQNAAASSPSFLAASNNSLPLVLDMDNENSEPSPLNGEPPMNTCDWRSQLLPDSRQKNINQLMETLKKHVPHSGQEGIEELMRIAVSFEEMIFNTAINQIFPFECIAKLKSKYRFDVPGAESTCPRMCKMDFHKTGEKGYSLDGIYRELGTDKADYLGKISLKMQTMYKDD